MFLLEPLILAELQEAVLQSLLKAKASEAQQYEFSKMVPSPVSLKEQRLRVIHGDDF